MFTANFNPVKPGKSASEAAKAHLRQRNWSYRRAAEHLGVTYQHLCLVLNGQRVGNRLIPRIMSIGESPRRYRVRSSSSK